MSAIIYSFELKISLFKQVFINSFHIVRRLLRPYGLAMTGMV